jgi:hypothetical protein
MIYIVVYSYRNLERHKIVDLKHAKCLDLTIRYLNFETLHSLLMASSRKMFIYYQDKMRWNYCNPIKVLYSSFMLQKKKIQLRDVIRFITYHYIYV